MWGLAAPVSRVDLWADIGRGCAPWESGVRLYLGAFSPYPRACWSSRFSSPSLPLLGHLTLPQTLHCHLAFADHVCLPGVPHLKTLQCLKPLSDPNQPQVLPALVSSSAQPVLLSQPVLHFALRVGWEHAVSRLPCVALSRGAASRGEPGVSRQHGQYCGCLWSTLSSSVLVCLPNKNVAPKKGGRGPVRAATCSVHCGFLNLSGVTGAS